MACPSTLILLSMAYHIAQRVVIQDLHTNITLLQRDGETLWQKRESITGGYQTDHSVLNVKDILDFAISVKMDEIRDMIERLITCNSAISQEGLTGHWGCGNWGKYYLSLVGRTFGLGHARLQRAGSDARMSGCEMPVNIVSGSGNQGITASIPVIEFAHNLKRTKEELYRALVLSLLITVHIKTGIGPVSAFCGAVCAGVGAGCGIAFLKGADETTINHTIVNAFSNMFRHVMRWSEAELCCKDFYGRLKLESWDTTGLCMINSLSEGKAL